MRAQLEADEATGVKVVFISDMRFPNEADLVKELGGCVIRIQRPGLDDGDGHASEHALDDYQGWNAEINNNADLAKLQRLAAGWGMTMIWRYSDPEQREKYGL